MKSESKRDVAAAFPVARHLLEEREHSVCAIGLLPSFLRRRFWFVGTVLVVVFLAMSPVAATNSVPVIYCTDLFHPHDDPDDHFDLAALYAMPELEVKAIILDQGRKQRQKPGTIPVAQMNWITGRSVPVEIGLAEPLMNPMDKAQEQPAEFQRGVALILKILRESPEPVRVAAVGSVRDILVAFNREPDLCRQKIERLLIFIGEASNPDFREYNVGLDPHAYVGLMRSGLPIWWVPCFDGGLWQNRGHASFWKASHRDVLQSCAPEVIQYFIYALEKDRSDPIAFLSQPIDAHRRETLFAGERNLWCTTVFASLAWPAGKTSDAIFGFAPVDVTISDVGVVHYGLAEASHRLMRFEVGDPANYASAMTQRTARLLERLKHSPSPHAKPSKGRSE